MLCGQSNHMYHYMHLKMNDYSYFHSVMTYDLLFWGHFSESTKIFRLQKKIIRIMMVCRCSDSCRKLLFNIEILPFPSQYIFFSSSVYDKK